MLETLPINGNYTLIMFLKVSSRIRLGKRGWFNLQKGYYAYTGSAVGPGSTSLRLRVARHLRKAKKQHWHIDYLLANRKIVVKFVVAARSSINKECELTKLIQHIEGATVPIAGFGASDCKEKCRSHLVHFDKKPKFETIASIYEHAFGHGGVMRIPTPQTESNG